jgi:hypothetical protein
MKIADETRSFGENESSGQRDALHGKGGSCSMLEGILKMFWSPIRQ